MTGYTLREIAEITHGQLRGNPDHLVRQVCTDTRRIDLPAESLFIALRGPSHDGHRFIREAWQTGIQAFLVDHLPEHPESLENASFILVGDTLGALQELAAHHRKNFTGKVISITGSNGKTIIKEWLAQMLQSECRVIRSPKSYNSQVGVPLSVLHIKGDEQYAVMEAGISRPGEMENLRQILNPDLGLICNIGDAHQENFSDLSAKTREKLILLKNCRDIFYCRDHEVIHRELTAAGFRGTLHAWSKEQPAELQIVDISTGPRETVISGFYRSQEISLSVPFSDPASVENLIHIWLILLVSGFDPEQIQRQANQLEPVRMRLEQKSGINRCTLINDYYNSDIQSLRIALDLLFQQTTQEKKTLILSDILQTGQTEEHLYREIDRMLEHRKLHRMIGIGPAIHRNRSLFHQTLETWPSTASFLSSFDPDGFQEEAILLKGARSFEFERISTLLESRIHATTLEIRMNDVRFNLEQYRKLVGPGVRIMAMVKAFSYGSGGTEMARFLANERIDYLGVAFADEGIDIRRVGIHLPIMVMNPDFQQSDLIIDHHLEPEIYSFSGLQTFARAARQSGNGACPVHIKLDTGMHRLGFSINETGRLAGFLTEHPEVYVKSVFSHLAASEDAAQDDFTHLQISRYNEACRQLENSIGHSFIKHILNSSGIERFPEAHFGMVRLGLGLYGLGNTGLTDLHQIATLKTVISQIHDLPAGETVGYGRKAVLRQPTRIGIIPVGYADGIDRRLGNGNYGVLVKGIRVPTVGNICMDMTMIDLNGTGAEEGDEIIVFSPDNPVTEMARILGTIPYEILTSISPRVKRIYQFD